MNNKKLLISLVSLVFVVGSLFGFAVGKATVPPVGGSVYNRIIEFSEGISVDGTTVIDGSGNWDGAVTGTTGTYSSTLGVTGETNLDTLVYGGDKTTLTSSATTSVTAAQICDTSLLEWAPTTASGDLTLPTSANLVADCLTADGDSKIIFFRNLTATAATTTQIVAGTGMILLEPDGQNIEIAGSASALIHLVRASSTAILVSVDELIDAD